MISVKTNIFVFITFNFVAITQGLEEMPPIEENGIVKSEAIIRNTFNSLFHELKLKKITVHSKLKEYLTIHKYFTSLALQDYETLNQIARLVRVNYKNINEIANFMGIINNLYEFEQSIDTNKNKPTVNNDENVITYILYFLEILKKFRETYSVNKVDMNINTNILKLIKEGNQNPSNNETDILSENEIWEPSARRIYKGKRTKIKHFPFMASIQIFNNFQCAGSIIKSDLIITASSCLQLAWNNRLFRENPAFLSARIGSSYYIGGGEVIPVFEIYFHPAYDPKTLKNNICLLRLSRHLKFKKKGRRVKRIDFDRQASNLPVTTSGITILGWGAKEHSSVIGNAWKNILSFSILDFYPLDECQNVYSRKYVTKKNFCAGFFSKGGGACNRDVGGPGIVDGKLMGVISFGSSLCGAPDSPTVFTKLGYYSDWIEEIMELDVPVSQKRTTHKPFFEPFTAPPSHTSPKATTFKIPPLTEGKMAPIPISLIDNQLRFIDTKAFKDFIGTMFNSSEVTEYRDYLKDEEDGITIKTTDSTYKTKQVTKTSISAIPVTEFGEHVERITKIIDVSSEESDKMHKDTAFTLMDVENESADNDFDKELEKLIDNVNLKKIVREEVLVPKQTKETVKDSNGNTDFKIDSDKLKNEIKVPLLYLSDNDKKDGVKSLPLDSDERKENHEGMSIPLDNFEDLTRSKKNIVSVLPESELYGLLSEVIAEEIPLTDKYIK